MVFVDGVQYFCRKVIFSKYKRRSSRRYLRKAYGGENKKDIHIKFFPNTDKGFYESYAELKKQKDYMCLANGFCQIRIIKILHIGYAFMQNLTIVRIIAKIKKIL